MLIILIIICILLPISLFVIHIITKRWLFVAFSIFFIIYGIVVFNEQYLLLKCPISYKEAYAFLTFQDDPHNEGQYIQDFRTGVWYDIDGKNPKVRPLTIVEMRIIPNIRERIIEYYINYLRNKKS